jgi:hypothetical protein
LIQLPADMCRQSVGNRSETAFFNRGESSRLRRTESEQPDYPAVVVERENGV